jgi:hypothetical protein
LPEAPEAAVLDAGTLLASGLGGISSLVTTRFDLVADFCLATSAREGWSACAHKEGATSTPMTTAAHHKDWFRIIAISSV